MTNVAKNCHKLPKIAISRPVFRGFSLVFTGFSVEGETETRVCTGFSVVGETETRVCTGFSVGGETETRVALDLGDGGEVEGPKNAISTSRVSKIETPRHRGWETGRGEDFSTSQPCL